MRRVTLEDIVKGRAYRVRGPMRLVSRRFEKVESLSPWSLTYLIKPRTPKAFEPRLRFGIQFPNQIQGLEESNSQAKPGEMIFAEPWRTFADRLRELGLDSIKTQNIIVRCPLAPKEALRVLDCAAQEMGLNGQHHWLDASITDSTWWHQARSMIEIQVSEIPPARTPKIHRWK